ncbi:Alpha/Beta hydrolase protein [Paraphoma chrysanthemicola]|nr:Alpha/Beta hydrolase protein [Paraphoma chrysanthemicola]
MSASYRPPQYHLPRPNRHVTTTNPDLAWKAKHFESTPHKTLSQVICNSIVVMVVRNVVALSVTFVASAMTAKAQNMSFGANNFYVSSNVTAEPITFLNQFQMTIAGNLFLPSNLDRSVNASAVVVGPPFGAVKEQSANLYATKLAEQGFVTISIDPAYWGASSGELRNAVLPDMYAESFSAAVDYLTLLDYVDRERIGVLGICGSGSWSITAAKIDTRIKALATVSMYDMGAAYRDGMQNAVNFQQRQAAIAAASRQRQIEVDGGETGYTGGTPQRITANSTEIDREFFDFYRTPRGERLGYPSPAPPHPKELFWIEGAGHVDLYDRTELIPFEKLTSFFHASLGAANATINSGH